MFSLQRVLKLLTLLIILDTSSVANEIGKPFIQIGHTSGVSSVAFSPDGKYILSGGDTTPKLWDIKSGKELKTFTGHAHVVTSVAFSPDGKYALSGSKDKTLKLWDITSGKNIKTFTGHTGWVLSVAFSPDSKYALSKGDDNTIKLWDIASEKEIGDTPDGKYALSRSNDWTLKLWDIASAEEIKKFIRHTEVATSVAFSPDCKYALAGSSDKTLKLWDIKSGEEIKTFTGYASRITSVVFSPDGKYALAGSSDKTLKLLDIKSAEEIKTFTGYTSSVNSIAFSPDSKYVLAGSGKTLKLWDIKSGEEIKTFTGYTSRVTSVAFDPDGKYAISGSSEETQKLWDTTSGRKIKTIAGHTDSLNYQALSPDGKYLLVGRGAKKTITLSDIKSGLEIKTFTGHTSWVLSVAYSPDGKYALSGGDDKTLKLWDISGAEETKTFTGHTSGVMLVAFSPDGKYLLSGSKDSTLKLWDIKSGKEIKTFTGHTSWVDSAAFSPDGKYLLSGSRDDTLRLWDIASGKALLTMIAFSDGEWVSITPDGYFDASANGAKHLNILTDPMNVTSVDAYYESFYRPDIIARVLKGEAVENTIKIASVKPAPKVQIINTPTNTTSDKATITLKLTEQGGGIGQVRLYRNGSSVMLDGERALKAIKSSDTKTYTITLEKGQNNIKAIVFNSDNTMQSEDALITIVADIGSKKPSLHAVVVGINEFKNPKISLNLAVNDAKYFSEVIKKQSQGLFDAINVKVLTSVDQTSKESIVAELKQMQSINPNDLFVFYVASHGTVEEGKYYLVTSNVGSLSTKKLQDDAITQDLLKELIGNIPTSKKVVLLDTCFSGAMGSALIDSIKTRGLSEDAAIKTLNRAVGGTIISASTNEQEALEGYKNHGLFTYVLTEGLKGEADSDKDGFIKTTELSNYIEDEVPELAEKVFKRAQYPTVNNVGQGFALGRNK